MASISPQMVAIGLLLAGILPLNTASAQPDPEARAQALVSEALDAQSASRHEEALVLFGQAAELTPHPFVPILMSRSLLALNRHAEARELLRRVPMQSSDMDETLRDEVRRGLAVCDEVLAETLLRFETPGVTGAHVTVDGVAVGTTPVARAFRRGTCQVRATLPGYRDAEKIVVVRGEAELTVTLPMERLATPAEQRWRDRQRAHRVAAWATLGTGLAAFGTGVGFLGNYLDKTTRHLEPNQHVEGAITDLALGGTLTVVGAALGATSAVLFVQAKKPFRAPTAVVAPVPGGVILDLRF